MNTVYWRRIVQPVSLFILNRRALLLLTLVVTVRTVSEIEETY